jgi:hypothetical protein
MLNFKNTLEPSPKIILKTKRISLKKVTYCLSYTAASYNYNDIYNIVAAL